MLVAFVGAAVAATLIFQKGEHRLEQILAVPKEPSKSLALMRIVLPVSLVFCSSHYWMDLLKCLGPAWPLVLWATAAIFLGVCSQFGCIVLGMCCTLVMGVPGFEHHNWHSLSIL